MLTPDAVYDAALDYLATATSVVLCSADPANYAAVAAVTLGTYTLTPGDGGGDFVIAAGDTSGRKLTLTAQAGTNASASGTGTHVAFIVGTTLLCTRDLAASLLVNSGAEFTIASFDVHEFTDAVNE